MEKCKRPSAPVFSAACAWRGRASGPWPRDRADKGPARRPVPSGPAVAEGKPADPRSEGIGVRPVPHYRSGCPGPTRPGRSPAPYAPVAQAPAPRPRPAGTLASLGSAASPGSARPLPPAATSLQPHPGKLNPEPSPRPRVALKCTPIRSPRCFPWGEREKLCAQSSSPRLSDGGEEGEKEKRKKRKRKVSFGGSSAIGNEDPLCSLAERKRCLILTRIAFKIKLFYLQACRAPQTLFGLLEGEGRHKMKICFIVGLSANKRLLKERQTKRVPGGGLPR